MKKAYGYFRYSSLAQADGDSERRQVELAESWARENGYQLEKLEVDEGKSAFKGEHLRNGNLGQFIRDAEDGKIERGSVLIVENQDRLSRGKMFNAMIMMGRIVEAGIDVMVLKDNKRYSIDSDFTEGIGLMIEANRAHSESESKQRRLNEVWQQKRNQAIAGKPDIITKMVPRWLDVVEGEFAVNKRHVKTIEGIFNMYCDLGLGYQKIAAILNKEGLHPFFVKGRTAKFWRPDAIRRLLTSRSLLGEYRPKIQDQKGKRIYTG
ncbi:MAG: recombinase family protein, partial [Desulfofustis sp.]|nr:recombinase family protein [Desulfofustis sp.]